MSRTNTCCIIGVQNLPKQEIERILLRLNREVEALLHQGVKNFLTSGTPGFDQIAASLLIAKKEIGQNIRLVFVLPSSNPDRRWYPDEKALFRTLSSEADEIIHMPRINDTGRSRQGGRHMVSLSAHCICACPYLYGRAYRMMRYAQRRGLHVVNVTDGAE